MSHSLLVQFESTSESMSVCLSVCLSDHTEFLFVLLLRRSINRSCPTLHPSPASFRPLVMCYIVLDLHTSPCM